MESAFSQIYLALQQRIKNSVAAIHWIEQDFGQENAPKRPNVAFPTALIDFPSADYNELGDGGQTCLLTISVKLLFAPFSQSYESAPDEVKAKALEYFEAEKQLVDALHGWQPDNGIIQPLVRIRASGNNKSGLRIRQIEFTTEFEEF